MLGKGRGRRPWIRRAFRLCVRGAGETMGPLCGGVIFWEHKTRHGGWKKKYRKEGAKAMEEVTKSEVV